MPAFNLCSLPSGPASVHTYSFHLLKQQNKLGHRLTPHIFQPIRHSLVLGILLFSFFFHINKHVRAHVAEQNTAALNLTVRSIIEDDQCSLPPRTLIFVYQWIMLPNRTATDEAYYRMQSVHLPVARVSTSCLPSQPAAVYLNRNDGGNKREHREIITATSVF